MDKLTRYKKIITKIFKNYENLSGNQPDSELEDVFSIDEKIGSWLWLVTGWTENERVNTTNLYVRLKNDKIYIEEDWTEVRNRRRFIARRRAEKRYCAFHEPSMRQYTEFAVT